MGPQEGSRASGHSTPGMQTGKAPRPWYCAGSESVRDALNAQKGRGSGVCKALSVPGRRGTVTTLAAVAKGKDLFKAMWTPAMSVYF